MTLSRLPATTHPDPQAVDDMTIRNTIEVILHLAIDFGMRHTRRYIEYEELRAEFFIAYYNYGRWKYGTKGHSDERLGRLSLYKAMMGVYAPYLEPKERVLAEVITHRIDHLRSRARALPDDGFKAAFMEELSLSQRRV